MYKELINEARTTSLQVEGSGIWFDWGSRKINIAYLHTYTLEMYVHTSLIHVHVQCWLNQVVGLIQGWQNHTTVNQK